MTQPPGRPAGGDANANDLLAFGVLVAWSLLPPVWAALVTMVVVVNTLLMWVGPFAHPLGRD